VYIIPFSDQSVADSRYVVNEGCVFGKKHRKSRVRFINLSPDAPSYSLEIQGDATTLSDRAFKTATLFKYIADKPKAKLLLRDKSTGQVIFTLPGIEFKKGFVYSVWTKGLTATTVEAQKISLKVSLH
jgi:hypothetical protein